MQHTLNSILLLGETALLLQFDGAAGPALSRQVIAATDWINRQPLPGLIGATPAYASITVRFDPLRVRRDWPQAVSPAAALRDWLLQHLPPTLDVSTAGDPHGRPYEVGVWYDGPDLPDVARRLGCTPAEVVERHTAGEYLVCMIGFLPGFPYLGFLTDNLVLPRRDTPRARVPAGSVAIAGRQTGIYPQASPGGWHLIGRTDVPLFDTRRNPPSLLKAGDRVRFTAL